MGVRRRERVRPRPGGSGAPKGIPPFEAFLEEHRRTVYRFLLASVGPVEADDCFQETFLSALRAYPRLRDGSNLRSWVLTIATRKAIDAGRGRGRRAVPVANIAEVATAAGADEAALDGLDPVWKAVAGLPPRQRAAVAHRFVLDMTYANIAAVLECTQESARANVYQGLKSLRETIGGRR
jgi:RNA polymerase sigma factor (sigma-70 family)